MGFPTVKKELNKMTKEQIVNLVEELYKKQSAVREYLDFYANPDQTKLLEKYKKKIDNAFYTRMGNPKIDLKAAKKAVSDFSKLGVSGEYLAELNLYLAEIGTEFTQTFGDIDEKFYQTIENAFYEGLLIMQNEGILDKYKDRSDQLETNAQGIGWGFSDTMTSIYWEFYANEEDEETKSKQVKN
jgi:hypothetical protein